jgi:large subunit ribosomal protein L29
MDIKELRTKDAAGLDKELVELRKAAFSLRMQKATQQLQNTNQIRAVRRDIARVHTLKTENEKKAAQK